MRSEVDNKKWGTIYLGSNKEATLDSLDAMQAAARQEQWNQRTQTDYLERVRLRATDRAREILGAAHTERQNLLTEARADAERIRLETQIQYAKATEELDEAAALRGQAQNLRDEAEALREAAQQEGFDQGLANARDELDNFRGAMGASIAVVLQTIERQNSAIFSAWREEVVELVQTCVEKGTAWVLDEQHAQVLRALVMESVRKLDNRHTVTLRVHPDDEAAVADMFAAAREAIPDVERWIVNGDPSVELGGLVVESPSSTVDNRLELRRTLVSNILQHLTLPEGEAEVIAAAAVHDVVVAQTAHIAAIAPYIPELAPEPTPEPTPEAEQNSILAPHELMPDSLEETADRASGEHIADSAAMEMSELPTMPDFSPDADAFADMAAQLRAAEADAPEFAPALASEFASPTISPDIAPTIAPAIPANAPEYTPQQPTELTQEYSAAPDLPPTAEPPLNAGRSSLEELERELLPLPEEDLPPPPVNSAQLDEVLSGGGFISEPESARRPDMQP